MRITDFLGIPHGHKNISFVDVTTSDDTELFLDPCLIEQGRDALSRRATTLISDYEDRLYADMRAGRWHISNIFDQAHEIHETRLGYGNGRNGKGKTPEGMRDCLNGLCQLVQQIPSINRIQDISVLVEGFAEDCMSDLLTNILQKLLTDFTNEQMLHYGVQPTGMHYIRAWDAENHNWYQYEEPYWCVDGRTILLVPKSWVRKNFLFKAHQYLYLVIIERMRNDSAYHNMTKKAIFEDLRQDYAGSEHWEYEKATAYSSQHPSALSEYHRRLPIRYLSRGRMKDTDLDMVVYRE